MTSADAPPPAEPRVTGMLVASTLAGFTLGVLWPAWQVAVEPAQVLAGLVRYPPGNPFHLYQTSLWTIWHPLLAPLLAAGVSERAVSIGVSGAVGALSFAGLSAFARAFGASVGVALACPFFLVFLDPVAWGFRYPILLLGHGHTYGAAGLAIVVLACGVLGCGRSAAGAFLLGVAPAFHASLGAWVGVAAGAALWTERRAVRSRLVALLAGGAVGAGLAAASLAWHLVEVRPGVEIDPALADRYLEAFVRLWDAHRRPPELATVKGFVAGWAAVLAFALLRHAKPPFSVPSRLALRIFLGCGLLGLALAPLQRWLPPQALPSALVVAMPTRLLNFVMLGYVPFLLAALWRFRADPVARWLLAGLALAPLLAPGDGRLTAVLLPGIGVGVLVVIARSGDAARVLRLGGFALIGFAGLRVVWRGQPYLGLRGAVAFAALAATGVALGGAWILLERGAGRWRARRSLGSARAPAGRVGAPGVAAALAFAATVGWIAVQAALGSGDRLSALRDRTNDRALAAAARSEGVLVVGSGIPVVQLRTRRPVLLDVEALDMLPYALAAGPELRRILDEVYGIDFFRPPPHARHGAVVPEQPVRSVWQRRTPEEWAGIKTRFAVADVLVRRDWALRLPEVARSREFVLYRIP